MLFLKFEIRLAKEHTTEKVSHFQALTIKDMLIFIIVMTFMMPLFSFLFPTLSRLQVQSATLLYLRNRDNPKPPPPPTPTLIPAPTRRKFLISSALATIPMLFTFPRSSRSASTMIDSTSSNLFVPSRIMKNGGSSLSRGIPPSVIPRNKATPSSSLKTRPTLYPPIFTTYLSRFLLSVDPAARSWLITTKSLRTNNNKKNSPPPSDDELFGSFSNSVELGLSDYFSGPYGSYASVDAAIAGLSANNTRTKSSSSLSPLGAREGVLNLFALLRARYPGERSRSRSKRALLLCVEDENMSPVATMKTSFGKRSEQQAKRSSHN